MSPLDFSIPDVVPKRFGYEPSVHWPEVFITGEPKYDPDPVRMKVLACADGLMGWAICMSGMLKRSGQAVPEKFGWGMMQIGKLLGVCALPDDLMAYSKANKLGA